MINIRFIKEKKQAVAFLENKPIGKCEYIEEVDFWNIVHTEVDSIFQGKGIAKKLVDTVIVNAKKENKKIIASCSYAKIFINEEQQ